MAFSATKEVGGETNKQHLNLSAPAFNVVQNDMFAFEEKTLSGFINRVFENYYQQADVSISLTLNKLQGELQQLFSDIPDNDRTKKLLIKKLIRQKEISLLEKVTSYDKGVPFKFWLNKNNFNYLTENLSECTEESYYQSRGKYIKCVIEEYARLPYVNREYIYYRPFMDSINEAIEKKKQLRVETKDGKIYNVFPYKILSDPLSIANYLVGYSRRYGFDENDLRPCSFRIATLESVKVELSKSAFLSIDLQGILSKFISSRGVQFMVGKEADILIRLTEEGILKYQRQSHLRPPLMERRPNNVFLFQCTTAQAEFYFFKFGRDAEILSPTELRSKFFEMYTSAQNVYRETIL